MNSHAAFSVVYVLYCRSIADRKSIHTVSFVCCMLYMECAVLKVNGIDITVHEESEGEKWEE